MTRTIHANVVTELAKDDFNMVSLVKLGFSTGSPEGAIFLTDGMFDVAYSGDTYLSSGHIMNIGDVSEDSDLRVGTLSITLSAAEQTYVSLFLSTDYLDIQVLYYKAILDDDYSIIGDPLLLFDGRISGFKIDEKAAASKLTIECASHWANFQTLAGRKTNSNSQQIFFTSDLGFDYATTETKDIPWGRS